MDPTHYYFLIIHLLCFLPFSHLSFVVPPSPIFVVVPLLPHPFSLLSISPPFATVFPSSYPPPSLCFPFHPFLLLLFCPFPFPLISLCLTSRLPTHGPFFSSPLITPHRSFSSPMACNSSFSYLFSLPHPSHTFFPSSFSTSYPQPAPLLIPL